MEAGRDIYFGSIVLGIAASSGPSKSVTEAQKRAKTNSANGPLNLPGKTQKTNRVGKSKPGKPT